MSPLVPWQRAETPVAVDGKSVAARRLAAGGSRRLWASTNNDDDDEEAEEEQVEDQEGEGSGKDGGEAVDSAASPAPPTPPPEPGAEAAVLLAELDQAAEGSYPRHVCIQGKLENSRRNYTAAFEAIRFVPASWLLVLACLVSLVGVRGPRGWHADGETHLSACVAECCSAACPPCTAPLHCSHPAVAAHLRASGERLLLLGHRSKWETVVIPEAVEDVVVVLESLPYQARMLLGCWCGCCGWAQGRRAVHLLPWCGSCWLCVCPLKPPSSAHQLLLGLEPALTSHPGPAPSSCTAAVL